MFNELVARVKTLLAAMHIDPLPEVVQMTLWNFLALGLSRSWYNDHVNLTKNTARAFSLVLIGICWWRPSHLSFLTRLICERLLIKLSLRNRGDE